MFTIGHFCPPTTVRFPNGGTEPQRLRHIGSCRRGGHGGLQAEQGSGKAEKDKCGTRLRAYWIQTGCGVDNIACILLNCEGWALNSAVECHPHTVEVVGSNPTAPTILWFLTPCGVFHLLSPLALVANRGVLKLNS
jgi:hypothetical protein